MIAATLVWGRLLILLVLLTLLILVAVAIVFILARRRSTPLPSQPLNRQVFHVGMVQTTNGAGLGLNLVGVALICLCLLSAKAFAPAREDGLP